MVVLLHIWYLLKRLCISPPRCTVSRLSLIGHLYKTDTQRWSLTFFTPFIRVSIRLTFL